MSFWVAYKIDDGEPVAAGPHDDADQVNATIDDVQPENVLCIIEVIFDGSISVYSVEGFDDEAGAL